MTTDVASGVWQYSLDLAQGLRAYDTKTTLCVLGPAPSAEQRAATRRIPGLELVNLDVPLEFSADTPEDVLQAASKVARAAGEHDPTIVHLNSPALIAAGNYPAPVVAVCHSCIASWWQAVRPGCPLANEHGWHKQLTAEGLRKADAVVAPSRAFAGTISQIYALSRAPAVIYNGRRPSVRANLHKERMPQGAFGFTSGTIWDAGKNIGALDAAAAQMDVPVFAADNAGTPPLPVQNLKALGRLSEAEIADWLSAKPIFISTAVYEPFGLAALEAAEAACPLVLSDIPTFRELWDGVARFVSPFDEMAISSVVNELARDAQTRVLLGAAARRRARRYTAEVMAAKTQGIYSMLVAGRSTRASRAPAL